MTNERAAQLQEQAWAWQTEGKLQQAVAACREAIELMAGSEGPESADVANLLNDLAEIQIEQQDFRTALTSAQHAWRIQQLAPSLWTGETLVAIRIKTLTLLGTIRRTLGEFEEAEKDLQEALTIASEEFGTDSEPAALAFNELGMLCKYFGRFEQGFELYARALKVFEQRRGEDSTEVGTVCHNLGGLLFATGDLVAAEHLSRKAWEISRTNWGDADVRTMADAVAYAAILDGLGRFAESEPIYRHALRVYEAAFGEDHYEIAATLHNLAASLAVRNCRDDAERQYRRALAIKEKILGSDSPDVALTRNNLGRLLLDSGRPREALPLLSSAAAILEARLLPGHPQRSAAHGNLLTALAQLS